MSAATSSPKPAGAIVVREPYGFESARLGTVIATLADPDDNYSQLMSPMGPDQATT